MGHCLFMRKGEVHTKPVPLPAGYTPLAYIQSSGTQYIDTGFTPTNNSGVKVKFSTSQSAGCSIAACDGGWQVNSFAIWSNIMSFGSAAKNISVSDGATHTIFLDRGTAYLDAVQIWTATGTFTAGATLTLFCLNRGGIKQEYSTMKLYACQVYDNGTLIRDFYPCINASGVVGLYDIVGKQFYGNAGTGVFTGSEVA